MSTLSDNRKLKEQNINLKIVMGLVLRFMYLIKKVHIFERYTKDAVIIRETNISNSSAFVTQTFYFSI